MWEIFSYGGDPYSDIKAEEVSKIDWIERFSSSS